MASVPFTDVQARPTEFLDEETIRTVGREYRDEAGCLRDR